WSSERSDVRAEIGDITRIWRNLISNAIKYTQASGAVRIYGGTVRLDTRGKVAGSTLATDLLILPSAIPKGLWVVGIVQDSGKGIREADQASIFARFYRGEAARTSIPGTGLGLSLVKELLTDYGGFVAFTSRPGEGSTFNFWLRAIEQD